MKDINTIKAEELKKQIVDAINNSNLPIILLDYIVKDLYNEIHILSCNQLIQDKQSYEKSIDKKPKEQKEGRK